MSPMSSQHAHQATRVRFAPSPTGLLHIGGLRSALFNWLWANHQNGTFVLRLEDTDRTRFVADAEAQISQSLTLLGLDPDESPRSGGPYGRYRQSERLTIYQEYAKKLIEQGSLYRCWCSQERLEDLRQQAQSQGRAFKYDRHCLLSQNQKSEHDPHVLRFRVPAEPTTIGWDDAVRGKLSVTTDTLDDFVAVKADGYPTYHFANVVDDHLMKISDVLRADEWIPSTPKHLLLYQAFGWQAPVYAHLPAVQGPTGGKKLSKRDGAQSVRDYLDDGYLPEALVSFLATLGWNDGTTQEIFTVAELIAKFSLDRVQKSPARFDKTRLTWVNGKFLRSLTATSLEPRCQQFWPAIARETPAKYRQAVLGLVQDRLETLKDLPGLTSFFFTDPQPAANPDTDTTAVLRQALEALQKSDFSLADLETRLRALSRELHMKPGQLFAPIRQVVTGTKTSPGLFETLHVLGKATVVRRLERVCG